MHHHKVDSKLGIMSSNIYLKTKQKPHYLHTGALFAVSMSRAHVWATISNVEIIQSPSLLFVKWSLL